MSETNCNNPLYRTYQVTKAIIVVPPLYIVTLTSLTLLMTGSLIALPVDYIITGDIKNTMGGYTFDMRVDSIISTSAMIGCYLIS